MIRELREEDIDDIVARLPAWEDEAISRLGIDPRSALRASLGGHAYVGVAGRPVCAFGLRFPVSLGHFPEMWLLTTVDLRAHRIEFLREARRWVARMNAEYGPIEAVCRSSSQRLLLFLGFRPNYILGELTRMRI